MNKIFSILMATSALALASACGGGGGGGAADPAAPSSGSSGSGSSGSSGGGTPAPTTPSYETLNSTASKTSTLGGVALRSNDSNGAFDIVTISGTTTHNTGNTTVTDGTYSLTDSDGFNGAGVLTDGSSTINTNTGVLSGTYEYVSFYEQSYTSGGNEYDSVGIGGVITSASDVPKTGSATYTGGAAGSIATATQGFELEKGTSTVTADFAAGTVDATLTGFTSRDQATGKAVTAPIDTISVTGMTIAGNGFSGGTTSITNAGAVVNLTGANTTKTAQGAFFGYDAAASAPDEVGGLILQKGDDGVIAGGFIAD